MKLEVHKLPRSSLQTNKQKKNTKFDYNLNVNPIQDSGGQKDPTSFSLVTSTNVGISSQNFLAFSFNLFPTLVQNLKFVPSTSLKILNLNEDQPSKK